MQNFEIANHAELIRFSKDEIDIDLTEIDLNQIENATEILEASREHDIPSDLVADTLASDHLLVLGIALHNLNLLCPSSDNLGHQSVLSFGGSGSSLIEFMRFPFGGASAA